MSVLIEVPSLNLVITFRVLVVYFLIRLNTLRLQLILKVTSSLHSRLILKRTDLFYHFLSPLLFYHFVTELPSYIQLLLLLDLIRFQLLQVLALVEIMTL